MPRKFFTHFRTSALQKVCKNFAVFTRLYWKPERVPSSKVLFSVRFCKRIFTNIFQKAVRLFTNLESKMKEVRIILQQGSQGNEKGKAGHLMFKSNPMKQNWEKYWVQVNNGQLSFYNSKKVLKPLYLQYDSPRLTKSYPHRILRSLSTLCCALLEFLQARLKVLFSRLCLLRRKNLSNFRLTLKRSERTGFWPSKQLSKSNLIKMSLP